MEILSSDRKLTPAENNQLGAAAFYVLLQQHEDELVGLTVEQAMRLASFESDGFKVNAQPIKSGEPLSSAFGLTQPLRQTYFAIWCRIAQENPERAYAMIENSGMSIEDFRASFPKTFASKKNDAAAIQHIGEVYQKSNVYNDNYRGNFPQDVSIALLFGRNNVQNQAYFFIENNRLNAEALRGYGAEVNIRNLYTYHNLGPVDGKKVIRAAQNYIDAQELVESTGDFTTLQPLGALLSADLAEIEKTLNNPALFSGDARLSSEELGAILSALGALRDVVASHENDITAAAEQAAAAQAEFSSATQRADLRTLLSAKVRNNNQSLTSGGTAMSYLKAVDLHLAAQKDTVSGITGFTRDGGIDASTLEAALAKITYTQYIPISDRFRPAPDGEEELTTIAQAESPPVAASPEEESSSPLVTAMKRTRIHEIYTSEKDNTNGIFLRITDMSGLTIDNVHALKDKLLAEMAAHLSIDSADIANSAGINNNGHGYIKLRPTVRVVSEEELNNAYERAKGTIESSQAGFGFPLDIDYAALGDIATPVALPIEGLPMSRGKYSG